MTCFFLPQETVKNVLFPQIQVNIMRIARMAVVMKTPAPKHLKSLTLPPLREINLTQEVRR